MLKSSEATKGFNLTGRTDAASVRPVRLCVDVHAIFNSPDTYIPQPVDLTKDVSTLGCVEVKLVRRAVVRVDIPTRSLAVKACPEKSVRDVLRPVLLRYGIKPTCVVVYLVSSCKDLCL